MARSRSVGQRRAKTSRDLARAPATRRARERALVVCEGGKTEPHYLLEFRSDIGLTNADIEICGEECGTDPCSVLEYALSRFTEDGGFDHIFCVFDKEGTEDRHINYNRACAEIKRKRMPIGKTISAIGSVPCFEYWVLLHFKYTTAAFVSMGRRSAADIVFSQVKAEMPDYAKGMGNLYARLRDRLDRAVRHAERALTQAGECGNDNPSTRFHELLVRLRDLKDS